MVCPFKKKEIRRNHNGYELFGKDDTCTRIEIEFGECDRTECMAFNPRTESCKMFQSCVTANGG